MSAPAVVLGAWEHPRGDIGPDRIELDVIRRTVRRAGRVIFFAPQVFQFAAAVIAASPRIAEYDDIDEALFGDREDGGPEDLRQVRGLFACRSRKVFPLIGIDLQTEWGRGYRAAFANLPELPFGAGANPPLKDCPRFASEHDEPRHFHQHHHQSAGACLP